MMDFSIEQLVFYFFALLVLGSALLVVTFRNVIRSVFLFFVTLFALAGVYAFTLADFVAVTQIVVYVGGVLVLMIFAFLLSDRALLNMPALGKGGMIGIHYIPGMLIGLGFFAVMSAVIWQSKDLWFAGRAKDVLQAGDNTLHLLGINLMTRYLLPFELLSVLLMLALVGAAHLARKERIS